MNSEHSLADRLLLAGKTAVVTGASSGIGRAIAIALGRGGADVVIHAGSNAAAAHETASTITSFGRKTIVMTCDFRAGENALRDFVEAALVWQNEVHIWVNNAGMDVLTGSASSWSFEEKLAALFEVDVFATAVLSRHVGPQMPPGGAILNMGWDQATAGMAGDSGQLFSATKAAVMALTKSLAKSLAPNVRVNCLAPGWIKTAWGEQASDEWQQRAVSESLLQRWGTPEDVARVATFLVGPNAEFINGQVIPVNGGLRD